MERDRGSSSASRGSFVEDIESSFVGWDANADRLGERRFVSEEQRPLEMCVVSQFRGLESK